MSFNDVIFISMKQHVAVSRYGEVENEYKQELGRRIQHAVRNRLDPGLTFRGHQRAQSVQVNLTDTGKLTIKSDEPGKEVLRPDRGEGGRVVFDREDTIDDLFTPSSGVPSVVESGGQRHIAFRTIREEDLFGRPQERQDSSIKAVVDHAVEISTPEVMTDAVKNVERRYPSDAVHSETIPRSEL